MELMADEKGNTRINGVNKNEECQSIMFLL